MARRGLPLAALTLNELNIVLGLLDDLTQNLSNTGKMSFSSISSGALTVKDADLTIIDDVDGTKRFQFQASGITAGNKRTLTVPDADGTIAITTINNNFSASQTATVNGNEAASIGVKNSDTGTSATAQVNAVADVAAAALISHGSGRVVSRCGVTLGGWAELLSFGLSGGLVIDTSGTTPIVMGTAGTLALTIDTSQDVTLAGALMVPYAPGSFTMATGKCATLVDELALTGTQEAILQGTSALRIS